MQPEATICNAGSYRARVMSELSKRYRAARAYAGLDQKALADALGVEVQTVKRRESGESDPKRMEQIAVAKICGLPDGFFTSATPLLGDPNLLLARLDDLLARIASATTRGEEVPPGPPPGAAPVPPMPPDADERRGRRGA
jgi:transcriptional regulator with XRE-family HTH domain